MRDPDADAVGTVDKAGTPAAPTLDTASTLKSQIGRHSIKQGSEACRPLMSPAHDEANNNHKSVLDPTCSPA